MKGVKGRGKGGGEHHPDLCIRFTRYLSIGCFTFEWNTKEMLEAEGRRRQRKDGHPEEFHSARMNANVLTSEMNEMLLSRLTTQERNRMRHELFGFQHRRPLWMHGEDLQQDRQISQGFRILPCPLPPSDCPRCSQEMGGWMFRWTWYEVSHNDEVHLNNVEDVRLLVATEADPAEVPTEGDDIVSGLAPKSSDAAPDRVRTDSGIEKIAFVLKPKTDPRQLR